jgi:hypothetical protein
MPEYRIAFEVKKADTMDLPAELLRRGRYVVTTKSNGDVLVRGSKDGLLYLAEVLARCALGGYREGFHVHVPLDSNETGPNTEMKPELTLYSAEEL